jgi:predicted nucleic acid-binding protein
VAALVDPNVLVYWFDKRFPAKRAIAAALLERGVLDDSIRLPHQAIVEFVAVVSRSSRGLPILDLSRALRVAEDLVDHFTVVYPNEAIVRGAVRAWAAYRLNWFDAHLLAYAEYYGLDELLTEDLQHGRRYGSVRVMNPFLPQLPN